MRAPDLLEYAATVVGFPINEGDKITLEESVTGMSSDKNQYTSEKGALAEVISVQMLPLPSQLTIMVQITIDEEKHLYLWEMFSEADKDPQFPFVRWLSPEEREAQAAEQAKIEAERAAKAEAAKSTTPPTVAGAVSGAHRPQQHQPGHHHRGPWGGHGAQSPDQAEWPDYY